MFVFFLFRCCWLLSYFISFYGSNTCLFSFWNKPPFERNLFYVKVFFNLFVSLLSPYHSFTYAQTRTFCWRVRLFFWSNLQSFLLRVHVYTLNDGRPGVKILGGQKRYRTETISQFEEKQLENSQQCHLSDDCCLVFVISIIPKYLRLQPLPSNCFGVDVACY